LVTARRWVGAIPFHSSSELPAAPVWAVKRRNRPAHAGQVREQLNGLLISAQPYWLISVSNSSSTSESDAADSQRDVPIRAIFPVRGRRTTDNFTAAHRQRRSMGGRTRRRIGPVSRARNLMTLYATACLRDACRRGVEVGNRRRSPRSTGSDRSEKPGTGPACQPNNSGGNSAN